MARSETILHPQENTFHGMIQVLLCRNNNFCITIGRKLDLWVTETPMEYHKESTWLLEDIWTKPGMKFRVHSSGAILAILIPV